MQRKIDRIAGEWLRGTKQGEEIKKRARERIKGAGALGQGTSVYNPLLSRVSDYRGRLIRSIHFADSFGRDDARVHVFTSETFVLRGRG